MANEVEQVKPEPPKMRFRVLAGRLVEGGRRYDQGDVVVTSNDLSKHNNPVGPKKFERLDAPAVVPVEEQPVHSDLPELDSMTVQELKAYAEEVEIDVGSAKTKDQLASAIRKAFGK